MQLCKTLHQTKVEPVRPSIQGLAQQKSAAHAKSQRRYNMDNGNTSLMLAPSWPLSTWRCVCFGFKTLFFFILFCRCQYLSIVIWHCFVAYKRGNVYRYLRAVPYRPFLSEVDGNWGQCRSPFMRFCSAASLRFPYSCLNSAIDMFLQWALKMVFVGWSKSEQR